jgi:hypothetical protein
MNQGALKKTLKRGSLENPQRDIRRSLNQRDLWRTMNQLDLKKTLNQGDLKRPSIRRAFGESLNHSLIEMVLKHETRQFSRGLPPKNYQFF